MKALVWTQIVMAAAIGSFITWYITKRVTAWYWKRHCKHLIKRHGPNAIDHF